MGNCSYKGVGARCPNSNSIRILTDSGRVLSFEGPKLVVEVLQDFSGHGIFGKGNMSTPLFHHDQLIGGQFYYLLPLEVPERVPCSTQGVSQCLEPVRMSSSGAALDLVAKNVTNGSGFEVLPPLRKGVWRVKLVINTKQLEDILSEEVNTDALIEQMRMAASLANVTPRSKSSWGLNLKPILCNVFKVPIDNHQK